MSVGSSENERPAGRVCACHWEWN